MNSIAVDIFIILAFPANYIEILKKKLLAKTDRDALIISESKNFMKIYNTIKKFIASNNNIGESINIYNISMISDDNENILQNDDGDSCYPIEQLFSKIENECLNKHQKYIKINKRKSIYINESNKVCGGGGGGDDKFNSISEEKVILKYNSNMLINEFIQFIESNI